MKDQFGRETKVGDIVIFSSQRTTGLHEAIVLKLADNSIRTSYGTKAAGNFVIVTEQLIANGQQDKIDKLRRANAELMDFTVAKPKKPSTKWKYALASVGGLITIGKLSCNNQGDQYGSLRQFMQGKEAALVRGSRYVGGGRGYQKSYSLERQPNGYYDGPFFKLSEIKDLGLAGYIEQEITFEMFQAAIDGARSADAVALKASGVWKK